LLSVRTVALLCSLMGAHGVGVRGDKTGLRCVCSEAGEGLSVEQQVQYCKFWCALAELLSLSDRHGGTWEVSGCPSRSHRTAGLGLPAAAQLQRRSDPMSASVSVITFSHSG